jgi:hypothetical protein
MGLHSPETPALVIGSGFAERDRQHIVATLEHLLPHLQGNYCLSGGIATAAQLSRAGVLSGTRSFNDVDVVLADIHDMRQSIRQDFAIATLDAHEPIDDFYVSLTDMETKAHVDLFGARRFPPEIEQAVMGKRVVPVRSAANLGALLLCAIDRRIREHLPTISKQFADAAALLDISSMSDIERNWRSFPPNPTATARQAWTTIQGFMAANPGAS